MRPGQMRHALSATREMRKDASPRRIGQRSKGAIKVCAEYLTIWLTI